MAYTILIRKKFRIDVQRVYAFLLKEWSIAAANCFLDDIDLLLSVLEKQPAIGSVSSVIKNVRSISVTKHNRLFYRINKNQVIVLSLKDTRRKNYNL